MKMFRSISRPLSLAVWVIMLTAGAASVARAGEASRRNTRVTVQVIQTTDVHGRIFPWDYLREQEESLGLAKVSTYVQGVRATGANVLLLDNGDTIQGTPLTYYYARLDPAKPHPMMLIMNAMGYDAMTVGNHEFNYGLDLMARCRREAAFPFLSANTYRKDQTEPFFQPYLVKQYGPVRIGILGLTTPNIPNWEHPANIGDLVFRDTVAEAGKWVRILREKERVDAVIIDTHEGFEVDLKTGQPNDTSYENHAYAIAREVPGVDVLLTGHAHLNIPPQLVNGVLVAEASRWAEQLTHVTLVFQKTGKKWQLTEKSGLNVKMDAGIAADPKILSLAEPYHQVACAWVQSPVGTAEGAFSAENVYVEDNALMDLLHRVMLDHTGADMSMASYLAGRPVAISPGPIRVRDIYGFYFYENTVVKLAIKGRDIKEALERAAEIYDRVEWDPLTRTLQVFQVPDFRLYNFDTLAGADYAVDPTRPAGERVVYLERDGRPLDPDREYTLAVSNYQAVGGGRYDMFKRGRWETFDSEDIRNLIISYIQKKQSIAPVCDHNWHLQLPARFVFSGR